MMHRLIPTRWSRPMKPLKPSMRRSLSGPLWEFASGAESPPSSLWLDSPTACRATRGRPTRRNSWRQRPIGRRRSASTAKLSRKQGSWVELARAVSQAARRQGPARFESMHTPQAWGLEGPQLLPMVLVMRASPLMETETPLAGRSPATSWIHRPRRRATPRLPRAATTIRWDKN